MIAYAYPRRSTQLTHLPANIHIQTLINSHTSIHTNISIDINIYTCTSILCISHTHAHTVNLSRSTGKNRRGLCNFLLVILNLCALTIAVFSFCLVFFNTFVCLVCYRCSVIFFFLTFSSRNHCFLGYCLYSCYSSM